MNGRQPLVATILKSLYLAYYAFDFHAAFAEEKILSIKSEYIEIGLICGLSWQIERVV